MSSWIISQLEHPLQPRNLEVVDAQLPNKGLACPWVFHRDGEQIKTFRGSWATACTEAGYPGRLIHDLRRSAVRNRR